jgi:hypothetical protein
MHYIVVTDHVSHQLMFLHVSFQNQQDGWGAGSSSKSSKSGSGDDGWGGSDGHIVESNNNWVGSGDGGDSWGTDGWTNDGEYLDLMHCFYYNMQCVQQRLTTPFLVLVFF